MSTAAEQDAAILLRDVWKVHRIYHGHGRGWLRSILLPFVSADRFSTASSTLRGVDLTVQQGEVLGVLGRNGSGKSTLLRVIAGMTEATSGYVEVHGSLRCMMAGGVGFNPRLSGRENIIFGSIAMGIPRQVCLERVPSIIEFAELEHHIDKPMTYYSKGMRSRLALAVAMQEVPDILILDEAMSGGDAGFEGKVRQRIGEVCSSGSTILLATHSLGLLRRICSRAVLLDEGELIGDGAPERVAQDYQKLAGVCSVAASRPAVGNLPSSRRSFDVMKSNGVVQVQGSYLCGADGARRDHFVRGERIELHLELATHEPVDDPRISVELLSAETGVRVAQIGAHYLDASSHRLSRLRPKRLDGRYELVVALPENPLGSGEYAWRVSVHPWVATGKAAPAYHLRTAMVCRFTSQAFPERNWLRNAILEPESEVTLAEVTPAGDPAAVDRAAPPPSTR